MDERLSLLFREVADLPREERQSVFAARKVSPELRAEVESLLASDAREGHAVTECIGQAAEQAVHANAAGLGGSCGPYRLVRLLGSGGMGAVYLAERSDGEIQQRVAIKMLRVGADRPSWQERFLRERQLLAYLNHPSVARLLDAGHTDQGQPYLVMEYVEGEPIDVRVASRSLRENLRLFLNVCEGVAHAHQRLIIHRDLKPSNIVVDASGQPKLLDFGIAKLLDESADQTQTLEPLLTPSYASPEQIRGGVQTTATDIYSLGAVLYKMLTGRSPHETGTGELQAIDIVAGTRDIAAPSRVKPGLPADVDSILLKTLRRQPEERYVSVEALASDIRAFLESKPVQARSGDTWYRATRFLRRRWLPVAASAVALTGLSVGYYAADRERVVAQRRFSETRQLANKLFEIERSASEFAGSTKTRQLIVDTALDYLRRLAADAQGDPTLAVELANAYIQVAHVQGGPSSRNLGHTEQAWESLRMSETLLQSALRRQPQNRAAAFLAASIANDRMVLTSLKGGRRDLSRRAEVLRYARQSEAWLEKSDVGPADLVQADRALDMYRNLGDQYLQARQLDDALRVCRRAAALARACNAREHLGMIAWVTAEVYQARGDLDDALRAIRESAALTDPHQAPGVTGMAGAFAHVLIWEGRILAQPDGISLGRPEEAVEALDHAFRMMDEVVHVDRSDQTSRGRLGMAGVALGAVLRQSDPSRALQVYDHTLVHLRETENNVNQRLEIDSLAGSSTVLTRLGRLAIARQRLDTALQRLNELHLYPADQVALGSSAYKTLRALAGLEAAGGRLGRAIEIDRKLLDQVKAAKIEPETSLEDATDLSSLYGELAGLHRRAGESDAAAMTSALRLQLWQNWARKLPGNAFVLRQWAASQY